MKEKQLENDAFVACITAPNAGLKDYLQNGLTVKNTQLLSADEYKSLPGVQKMFTDEQGVFDDDKFQQVYRQAEKNYLELSDQEAIENLLAWSPTSRYAPVGSKQETYNYTPETGNNPTRRSKSITGLNQEGPEKYTEKELAQMGKIWDSEKGEWRNGTAEDLSIWDKITGESLVYARYTKDGEQLNPITGQMEFHRQGEWMKDEDGNYFTRTIKTEDLGTNEIVNLGDILTKEDSWMNKLDPLDSDEKKKSLPGVIAKTALLAIPWLIPGFNEYYAALSVATGLTSLGATFAKAGEKALLGQNNSGFGKGATAVENWFKKFSVGTSEENAQSFFSLENLGQQMADTFGQLHQQRWAGSLANIFYRSLPDEKQMEKMSGEAIMKVWDKLNKRNELGATLSLGYMGLVSAADVYNDALNSGYDERTAGLTALASAGSLFGIMRFNETAKGLGTWFLKSSTGYDHEITRQPVVKCAKKLYKQAEDAINKHLKTGDTKELNNFFGDMWSNTKSWLQDTFVVGGEEYWKNALVEGVEEVSEEAIQDMVKGVVDTLSYFGYTAQEGSFGGWSNVFSREGLSRYFQTAAGGALGGALFKLQELKIEPTFNQYFLGKKPIEKINDKDIVDLILQGRGEELKKELVNLKSIFNTKRGATGFLDENTGEIHDLKADGQRTQADLIVDEVLGRVNAIEKTIESIVPRTYFGTLSTMDERRFRENLQFNGIDLEPVFFHDFSEGVKEAKDAWMLYQQQIATNKETTENNEDTSKPKKELVDEKAYKENFEKKLQRARTYFDPKQQAYRQVLGKVLTSGQIAYGLSGGYGTKQTLDKNNWMKIFFPNITKSYEELDPGKESDPDFLITQKYIDRQYESFYKAWGEALSKPEELAKRMRPLTELYMNASLMLQPIQKMTDLQHKTARMKIINEYKPAEIYQKYVDQLNLDQMFKPIEIEELNKLSDEDKERVIQERRQKLSENLLSEGQAYARDARLIHFADIAQKNPFAFSARERINFDLADAMEKRGVLTFTGMDDAAKEIFKGYINQIAQDSGLSVFNKQTLEALMKAVNNSFYKSDNLFIKAMMMHAGVTGARKIDDVDTSDENSRQALIDLVSPTLDSLDLDKLDSEDFYEEKIQCQIAFNKTKNAKEGDTSGLTDPREIVKTRNQQLSDIITDNNHPVMILQREDVPVGVSDSDLTALNNQAQDILSSWNTATFDELQSKIKDYYKFKYSLLQDIYADKTIELAQLKGIEDLIGTDTIIDKKLLDQIQISFTGAIEPALMETLKTVNETLPMSEQITIVDESQLLQNLEAIDLAKVQIGQTWKETEASSLLEKIIPMFNDRGQKYTLWTLSTEADKTAYNMAKLHDTILKLALKPIPAKHTKELADAQQELNQANSDFSIQEQLVENLESDPDVEEYMDLLDQFNSEEDETGKQNLQRQIETKLTSTSVQRYIKESQDLVPLQNAKSIAEQRVSKALTTVRAFQAAKEQCLKFINMLHDEMLRYQKILKNKTVIDTEDPVIEMMKNFYHIIHGNENGDTVIDKLAKLEHDVRLSDVTGDTLQLDEAEKACLDDVIETTQFINYIIDGSIRWGDASENTAGQNINEVWRDYEQTFGDKEKAKKIVILEANDGITVQSYLASINQRARDLKALYAELNKSKSVKYEEFRISEVKSKIKFLQSDVITKFHVFDDDDDEVNLLDGVDQELLDEPDSAAKLVEMERIVSQNLHNYYNKRRNKFTSEEEFEKVWSEKLIDFLLDVTDNDSTESKIKIKYSDAASLESRLYQMSYSWEAVEYDGDEAKQVSVPGLAMWMTQLAKTDPVYRYNLLQDVYNGTNISPRIDQENAILAIDFAVGHKSICNALEDAIVKARIKHRKKSDPNYTEGPAYKNVYTLFGTGGSGKTLLMQMLSKHYGDEKAIHFSAILQEKVDDLVNQSEKTGKKRSGKKLHEYFTKLEEYDQTFESAVLSAVDHINEKLFADPSTFVADPTSLNGSIGDITLEYKTDTLSADKSRATFIVKTSNNIEFELTMILPPSKNSVGTVDYIDVTKVPTDITVDTSLKNSILFMDEITQLSPLQWQVMSKAAQDNNFIMIGAGDPIQKGWETKRPLKKIKDMDPGKVIQSMEKYNILTLGNLYGAWRADTTSLQETVEHLYTGLYKYLIKADHGDAVYRDDDLGLRPGERKWSDVIADLKSKYYTFTYTLQSGIEGFPFIGTYMPETNEQQEQVYESINSSSDASKVIIVDDGTDINELKKTLPGNIKDWEVLPLSEVQGKEFDYSILWKLSANSNRLQSSRELFTALTRAKKGQVIISRDLADKTDLFRTWEIDHDVIKYSSSIKPYQTEARDNYAQTRAQEIQTIAQNITPIEESLGEDVEEDPNVESGAEHAETIEDEHAVDESASESITTEAETESGISAEGYSSTTSGSREADRRNKAVNDTWAQALNEAGQTGSTPVGTGDWYTRLGISAKYIYGLEDGESYYNVGTKSILKSVISESKTLSDWQTELNAPGRRKDTEYTDLFGFIVLLQEDPNKLKVSDVEKIVLSNFKTQFVNRQTSFTLDELINLFESFKKYVYNRSSDFVNIFYKQNDFQEDFDYSFRKINDSDEIQPYFTTGIVFQTSAGQMIYITTGAVNKDALGSAKLNDGKRITFGHSTFAEGVIHKVKLAPEQVKKINQSVANKTQKGPNSHVHSMTSNGGVYQVTSGVNLRIGDKYKSMNKRFGNVDFGRYGLSTILALNFEVLTQGDIEELARNGQIDQDVLKLFKNGLYIPVSSDPAQSKSDFKKLTEVFRWASIDDSQADAYMNFHKDRWILVRKKGDILPTLTRISYVSGGFNLDPTNDSLKHFTGSGKNGRNKLLSKYKHRQLINAFLYQACAKDPNFDFYDAYRSFTIFPADLIAPDVPSIKMSGTSLKDEDLFTQECIDRINNFKTQVVTKIATIDPALQPSIERLVDSYIARLKWNAIWIKYAKGLKNNGTYYAPGQLNLIKYLGSDGSGGLRRIIINSDNYSKAYAAHNESESGIKMLLDIVNNPDNPMYNYFYENAQHKIQTMEDVEANKDSIIVEYVNEGTRSFVNTSEYAQGYQVDAQADKTGDFKQNSSLIATDAKNLLNYILNQVFHQEAIGGLYSSSEKSQFIEQTIQKLIKLYIGKDVNAEWIDNSEWEEIMRQFLGDTTDSLQNGNSVWKMMYQLHQWATGYGYASYDELPDLMKLITNQEELTTAQLSDYSPKTDFIDETIKNIFGQLQEKCSEIKDDFTKNILKDLFTNGNVESERHVNFSSRFSTLFGEDFTKLDTSEIACLN